MSDTVIPIPQTPLALTAASPVVAAASTPAGAASTTGTGVSADKLKTAAQQFEAIFLRQIMAEAHKANFGNELFSSQANDTFTSMQDAKFADIAAKKDVFGLAKMIENVLAQRGAAVSAAGTTSGTGGAA